jgi:CRP-like cAMP-binding protein
MTIMDPGAGTRANGRAITLPPASGIARAVKALRICKNRDVIVAGRGYGGIYLSHDGWLFRYKILRDGSRQIVDFILPGQIFGLQSSLFQRALYSVATITDCSLSLIPFAASDDLFEREPAFARQLFSAAVWEAAVLAEHPTNAARRSAYQRVSHFLLELFVRLEAGGHAEGTRFFMPLTQELIGDALGLTTVHVNRTFRALREDKLIALGEKSITILDFEALARVSDFENSYLGENARLLRERLSPPKNGAARAHQPATDAIVSAGRGEDSSRLMPAASRSAIVPQASRAERHGRARRPSGTYADLAIPLSA